MRGKRKSQANQRGSDSELSLLPTFIVCWGIILLDLCMQGIHQSLCSSGRFPLKKTESIRYFYIYCGPVQLVVLARTVFPILKIQHIGRLIPLSFSGTTQKLIFARKPGLQDCECEAPIFYENMNTLPKTWTQKSSKQLEQRKSHGSVRSLPAPLRKKSAG